MNHAESMGVDLGDPSTFDPAPPHAHWARLRETSPITRARSSALDCDFWSLTGWKEIRALLSDNRTFVSHYGVFLGFGPHHPDPAGGRMLGVMDGEPHKALRDEVRSIFGARNIARFDTELDELFEEHMTPTSTGTRSTSRTRSPGAHR
ncbi:hypothetical protein ACFQZ4_42975 [Catellatospora coxensis]